MLKPEHGSVKLTNEKVCLSLQEIGQTVRHSDQITESTKHFAHTAWYYYSLCFQSWCDSGWWESRRSRSCTVTG